MLLSGYLFAVCLIVTELINCGDQRRLTGNGSALEVVLHDYALYKSTFTLLYFTVLVSDVSKTPQLCGFTDLPIIYL